MAITYDEILDIIMIESGQYLADLSATLLDQPKVETMIKRELGLYSRYNPKQVSVEKLLYNEKVFTVEADGEIPTAISDIRTNKFSIIGYSVTPMPASVHNYYWRYDKPKLSFRYPEGMYNLRYFAPHTYDTVTKTISSIELHDRFINLLVGRFLQTVGKSRRAFTLSDLPITMDASEMISDGKELYDATLEEIRTNSAFQLSILI